METKPTISNKTETQPVETLESVHAEKTPSILARTKEYVSTKIGEGIRTLNALSPIAFAEMGASPYNAKLDIVKEKYTDLLERETYFEEHPNEELAELRKYSFMSEEEVSTALGSVAEGKEGTDRDQEYQQLFNTVFSRIDAETGYLDAIDETIGKQNLLDGKPAADAGVPIKFGNKSFPEKAGVYTGKSVFLETDVPTPLSLLQELATEGKSSSLDTLHHELIHKMDGHEDMKERKLPASEYMATGVITAAIIALGVAEKGNMSGAEALLVGAATVSPLARLLLKSRGKEKTAEILTEAHAHIAGRKAHLEFTTDGLAEHLSKNYGVTSEENIEKVYTASDSIQRLHALGMTEKEIGSLVHSSVWNDEKKTWPEMQEAIVRGMSERNVSEEELNAFMQEERMRNAIDKLKVKKIAQEEIKKLSSVQKDSQKIPM